MPGLPFMHESRTWTRARLRAAILDWLISAGLVGGPSAALHVELLTEAISAYRDLMSGPGFVGVDPQLRLRFLSRIAALANGCHHLPKSAPSAADVPQHPDAPEGTTVDIDRWRRRAKASTPAGAV